MLAPTYKTVYIRPHSSMLPNQDLAARGYDADHNMPAGTFEDFAQITAAKLGVSSACMFSAHTACYLACCAGLKVDLVLPVQVDHFSRGMSSQACSKPFIEDHRAVKQASTCAQAVCVGAG